MNTKQRGFTLVELLITLAISGTLIAGLGQILLQSKQTYKTQQTLSHMMEDGRYILEVLTKETRRIGFLRNRFASSGGAVGDAVTIFVTDPNVLNSGVNLSPGVSISGIYSEVGFEDATGNVNPHNVNKLVFRYQINDANELSAAAPDYANSPCTRDVGLGPADDPTIDINVVSIYLYVDYDNTNTPVLYCTAKRTSVDSTTGVVTTIPTAAPMALLSNVERFLVLYGVDTDADKAANVYQRADSVVNWTDVVSIRLYVVLRSEEMNVAQNDPSYRIDGQSISPDGPTEKRLYRVFSTTISSRNN